MHIVHAFKYLPFKQILKCAKLNANHFVGMNTMSHSRAFPLNQHLIAVSGQDQLSYLHGQLTQDLNLIKKPSDIFNLDFEKIKNKFEINHRVTNKDIKITNYVYFLKNDKNVSLSTENWYNLAKINVGIPKYFDKAIKVYRSEYEKSYVQKVEKRG